MDKQFESAFLGMASALESSISLLNGIFESQQFTTLSAVVKNQIITLSEQGSALSSLLAETYHLSKKRSFLTINTQHYVQTLFSQIDAFNNSIDEIFH